MNLLADQTLKVLRNLHQELERSPTWRTCTCGNRYPCTIVTLLNHIDAMKNMTGADVVEAYRKGHTEGVICILQQFKKEGE